MFDAYLRERFPLRIFGVAAIGIASAAWWTSAPRPKPVLFAYTAGLSGLLLLQFRLWDDLEDRVQDTATHPGRVLVRTPAAPYWRVLTCVTLMNVALCGVGGWTSPIEIVFLDLGFYAAYRRMRRYVPDAVWRFSILLIKYPAFVVVVATVLGAPQPGRLAAAAMAAYATAFVYEALHGKRLFEGVTS
jgi:hypothetical protein